MIIIIPNCQLLSGWLCLTFGSGMGIAGLRASYLNLFNTPVSRSHMVAFWNKACVRSVKNTCERTSQPENHYEIQTFSGLPLGMISLECAAKTFPPLKWYLLRNSNLTHPADKVTPTPLPLFNLKYFHSLKYILIYVIEIKVVYLSKYQAKFSRVPLYWYTTLLL